VKEEYSACRPTFYKANLDDLFCFKRIWKNQKLIGEAGNPQVGIQLWLPQMSLQPLLRSPNYSGQLSKAHKSIY
jgi:hypothetical protein